MSARAVASVLGSGSLVCVLLAAACDTGAVGSPATSLPAAGDDAATSIPLEDGGTDGDDASVATDATTPLVEGGVDAGHGYDAPCTGEGDAGNCEPGYQCFAFSKYGRRCTIACLTDDECIGLDAGSKSCATKGVCRPPIASK